MGISEKVWDVLTTVIKMDDKVERMADTIKSQQMRIEDLTMRVVRLETALEIALASQKTKATTKNNLLK
jgi:FtsZ-binding cell division protein ZapB